MIRSGWGIFINRERAILRHGSVLDREGRLLVLRLFWGLRTTLLLLGLF